ncbi:alpha-2Da adrenergic receptor [Periplaneta americana]|uniref:alpha-2Da adrenergic receptor n=1 Tax=Periplaneta americana TaxID=6978 RepID=UPI0037E83E14
MTPVNVTAAEAGPLLGVELLALVSMYGIILVAGVIGNSMVAVVMCTQQTARMRNNLMLSVCVSDLLVCALSGPLAAASNTYHNVWMLSHVACKLTAFLQILPVTASLLSLSALSMDRYASVKHPRAFSQLRPRRHAMVVTMIFVWGGAVLTSSPVVVVNSVGSGGQCEEAWASPTWRTAFNVTHLALVFLAPCLTVAVCHFAVGHKLCEVSLTAAAARGQLPLPMPILRRPKHVIIVASVANDAPSKVIPYRGGDMPEEDDSSDNEALALQIRADLDDLRPRFPPRKKRRHIQSSESGPVKLNKLQRATRSERSIVRANRRLRRPPPPCPRPPLVKTASRQSLHSRRHLANMLAFQVAVLAVCWLPYVGCALCVELCPSEDVATASAVLPYCLLLGHAHSAINPALYWLLNRQSLQLPGCAGSQHRLLSGKLRLFRLPELHRNAAAAAPSSTNEAALGPFHPRYVNFRQQPQRFPTSHFLQ